MGNPTEFADLNPSRHSGKPVIDLEVKYKPISEKSNFGICAV